MTAPVTARPTRRARRAVTGRAVTYTVLVVGLIAWMLPFAWMLLGSVKTQAEILQRPPTWWPREFTWDNFAQWFGPLDIGRFFTNSIVVALLTVLGNLVFCSMVGYALAKMDFPGKKILFAVVLVTLMVPGVVTFVPLFVMVSSLGLTSSYAALILPFITTPLGVFLMRQFMLGIPDEDGLHYVGRVGTGFGDRELSRLAALLEPLRTDSSPLLGVPVADASDALWVRPELVGEVEYAEFTPSGTLRHARWRGLRPDVDPADVRRDD